MVIPFFVTDSVAEVPRSVRVESMSRLRVGNGLHSEVELGPLINDRQLRTVEAHVDDAVERGAARSRSGLSGWPAGRWS